MPGQRLSVQHLAQFQQNTVAAELASHGLPPLWSLWRRWRRRCAARALERHPRPFTSNAGKASVTNVAINRYSPPPVTSCHYCTPLPGASKLSVSGLVGAPNKCTALAALNLSEMSKCFLLADFHIFDFSCNLSTQRHIGRSSPSTATHNAQLSELFCQIEVFERPEGSCTDVDRWMMFF